MNRADLRALMAAIMVDTEQDTPDIAVQMADAILAKTHPEPESTGVDAIYQMGLAKGRAETLAEVREAIAARNFAPGDAIALDLILDRLAKGDGNDG